MGVVGVVPVMLMVLALEETLQELQLGETSMTVSAATTFLHGPQSPRPAELK